MIFTRMAFAQKIIESGIAYTSSKSEKRNIMLSNYISIVIALAVVLLLIARFLSGRTDAGANLFLVGTDILFLVPLFLNNRGFIYTSRYFLSWVPSLCAIVVAIAVINGGDKVETSDFIGNRFFLLGLACIPFLIFNAKRPLALIVALAGSIAPLLFYDAILNFFNLGYYDIGLTDSTYNFNLVRVIITFLIIGFSFYFLKRVVENQEVLNERLVDKLKDRNQFIQRHANDEVYQLNEQLKLNFQQLSEREFILNESQRIAKIGSWEYHVQNSFLFWSDEMYAIFGLDKSLNVKVSNMKEALGEEGSETITNATIELFRTNQPFDKIIRTKTPLGYTKWFRVYAFPILERENAIGIRGICHDITFFKEAEEKLKSSEAKFSKVFENYPDFIMVVRESDLLVVDVNQRITNVLGFEREEVIGRSARLMDLFLTEEAREKFISEYKNEGYIDHECSWKRRDGRIIQVMITGIRLDIEGQHYRMSVVKDITATRFAEQEKERARYLLNERIKELTTLYRTSQILRNEQKPFYEMLHEIILVMPGGWQYPEITAVRINLGKEELATPNFKHAKHRQLAEFYVQAGVTGFLEIAYTEDKPVETEGPFLAEERDLIDMIADMIGEFIIRKHEQESLVKAQANLTATINNTEVLIWSVDRQFNLITFNTPFFESIKRNSGVEVKIGSNVFDPLITPEGQEIKANWIKNYTRALAGEVVTLEESSFGTNFQFSLSPIIEDNVITGVSVFADNVTELNASNRQLAEANKKISELKLMALRSVMSPHFIFNVLNSIQFFIAKNDRLNAINYLSTFSKLIRSVLTHSISNKIKLSDEIELLRNYVHLEMTRFESKFDFVLNVNSNIDGDSFELPSLLIQPYVENAILHGLYNKTEKGRLTIKIDEEDDHLVFRIEDNGIGRAEAMRLRQKNFPTHKSMGIKVTEERLKLINQHDIAGFEIQDLTNNGNPSGTRVIIKIALS